MTDFKEINYLPNSANQITTDAFSNGSNTIEVESVANFDTAGTLYAIDTEGTLQKLTYTGQSDETFTGVSSWEGSGNLAESAKVYGDYYVPDNVTFTERILTGSYGIGTGYETDDDYIFGPLNAFAERTIS